MQISKTCIKDKTSKWLLVTIGLPQGLNLGVLSLLISINDIPNDIVSTLKMFADDTSLFVKPQHRSKRKFEKQWACCWKMLLNPDMKKQDQEVIFSRKITK